MNGSAVLPETTPEKVIEVIDVYKSFEDKEVLKGVSLHLNRGENLVVMGRSGSGKSVLIKIISRLLKQDKGEVFVFGQEVSALKGKELMDLRLKIGFSFQSSALYDSMTVRQNLEFPLVRNNPGLNRKEIDEKVAYVLEAVELLSSLNQMPSELSGGQRKRVGIARTLILQPEIMLYDEPTGGLDPITSLEINKLINLVRTNFHTSSIIITHDLTSAKETGDRISMLHEGKFIITGTFDEVFKTGDPRVKGFYDYNFIT